MEARRMDEKRLQLLLLLLLLLQVGDIPETVIRTSD